MSRLYIKGIGMMVGLIVGAGMFALPYSFAKAGVFWGVFHLAVSLAMMIFLHLWYAEVCFYTKGNHRFAGYVEAYLGKKAKNLAFITTMGAYYGSLLVYGILGGQFLANFTHIFNGYTPFVLSIFIFALGGFLALFNLNRIADINFYLTVPIFGFVLYLAYMSAPHIKADNFFTNGGLLANKSWFLPYGIWLFSLSGFSAVPAVRDIFAKKGMADFKKIIVFSILVAALFYSIFIFSTLGASGSLTTEDGILGMAHVLGEKALAVGSMIGFLAVFTSYVALAVDAKYLFIYDYKMSHFPAWLVTIAPPAVLFLLGINGLAMLLAVIGSLGMGTLGIFIILMRRKMLKTLREGDEKDIVAEIDPKKIKISGRFELAILVAVISAVAYDLWNTFAKF